MKLLRYFLYHAVNWNIPLAFFALYHTLRGEKKYGLNSFVASNLDRYTIKSGDRTKASRYEAVNYAILEDLLVNFRKLHPGILGITDAGCGKGRALVVAAHYGFTKLTGIDFAKELCEEARANLEKTKIQFPEIEYKIVCDDILNYEITDENCFFLFNPFGAEIFEKFMDNLDESVRKHPRPIYILYASPVHKELLLKRNFQIIYHVKKMRYLEGVIAERNHQLIPTVAS